MTLRDQVEEAYEQSEYEAEGATAALDRLQPLAEAAGDTAALVLCHLTRIHIRQYAGVNLAQTRLEVQQHLATAVALGDPRLQGQVYPILCLVDIHRGAERARAGAGAGLCAATPGAARRGDSPAHPVDYAAAKHHRAGDGPRY